MALLVMLVLMTVTITVATDGLGNLNQTARAHGSVKALEVAQAGENNQRAILYRTFNSPSFQFFPATGSLSQIPAPSGAPGSGSLSWDAVNQTYVITGTGSGTSALGMAAITKRSISRLAVVQDLAFNSTGINYFKPSSGCLMLTDNAQFKQSMYVDGNLCLTNNAQIIGGLTRSGTRTAGSATITGLSATSDIRVGAPVRGTGIPTSPVTTVASIVNGTTITLSANATASGTSTLSFSTTQLFVNGSISISNNSSVGTSSFPLGEVHVTTLCSGHVCGAPGFEATDKIWAFVANNTIPTPVTAPTIDWTASYNSIGPGPMRACSAGSTGTLPTFDVDTNVNDDYKSNNITTKLFPASNYDCKYTIGTRTIGRLTWTASTQTLAITGSAYFDGYLLLENNKNVLVTGKGTLYLSGDAMIRNAARICGVSACNATWDWSTNLLVIATLGNFGIHNHGIFQGNVDVVGRGPLEGSGNPDNPNTGLFRGYTLLDNSAPGEGMYGAVTSSDGIIRDEASTFFVPNQVPFGSPGSRPKLVPVPGSWRQG